ncbi:MULTISPECIES: MarR family winged helix-turn-helix transcriptional regulator [unclassified Aliiroseovarius]|uniref:MarR family winged helix-turn-helix transcriptional regulator n=1 Tax=unclassified Aliiroseovarius TaxID=2623558 RepID=UPI001568E03C|nr:MULTISPECIES: MarR family transcriptional regulator [unclassified Aliiroseovarius]NRP13478.1 Transcriptional repressor MprA [Aliiroseovarius sp. xm-d-517]NRP42649.1 Transcriptional repressor MprA [Aliiroseovarius sp. xm-m-339-2]NRP63561.1 Transcriptional repressor MprA [Aliiroseovarius sp. xm-a-151]
MTNEKHIRENQTLVLALLRSQQLFMRAMGPVFRSGGLTAPQWDALETLSNKGPLSINDLMRLTLSTSGNLDVVVKNLIQAGWVEKTVDENDRRARVLRLTPAGHEKVAEFMPTHNRALEQVFAGINAQDKRQAIRVLNQLRKKLPQSEKDKP